MRQFQNLETQKLHDKNKAPLAAKAPKFGEDEEAEAAENEAPEGVVAEHGKAHEVHIKHEHESGAHHVHSVHEDGFESHSEHGSPEEAHEHGKKLAGSAEHEGLEDEAADDLEQAGHVGNKAKSLGIGTLEE
jgi:hypothetical protein